MACLLLTSCSSLLLNLKNNTVIKKVQILQTALYVTRSLCSSPLRGPVHCALNFAVYDHKGFTLTALLRGKFVVCSVCNLQCCTC